MYEKIKKSDSVIYQEMGHKFTIFFDRLVSRMK